MIQKFSVCIYILDTRHGRHGDASTRSRFSVVFVFIIWIHNMTQKYKKYIHNYFYKYIYNVIYYYKI